MAELVGYVNPRSLGNSEPQEFFGMDLFFEQGLWDKYIFHKNPHTRDTRTWDVCWMLRTFCAGPPQYSNRRTFPYCASKYGNKEIKLCVYWHPDVMALCVGLSDPETKGYLAPKWSTWLDEQTASN
jgi:hypothetical protein